MTLEEMIKTLEANGYEVTKREQLDPWIDEAWAYLESIMKTKGVYLDYRMNVVKCTCRTMLSRKLGYRTIHQVSKDGDNAKAKVLQFFKEVGEKYICENEERWKKLDKNRKNEEES